MSFLHSGQQRDVFFWQFWRDIYWPLVGGVLLLGLVGIAVLYSVADSDISPWAWRHGMRLLLGLGIMLAVAAIDLRTLFNVAYPAYGIILILLLVVALFGETGMGAQRWLDFGVVRLQPSEFMKLTLVLALARYYQNVHQDDVSLSYFLIVPILLIGLPALLIFQQPDLGTSIVLIITGLGVLFLAGVNWRYFAIGGGLAIAAIPVVWQQLRDYQKDRVLVFLNPERDPSGAGYHIIQSKIGIGSGGFLGKGFGEGTQSRLNFLPEKHTDFIFTIFAEEFGFVGCFFLFLVFVAILFMIFRIATIMRNPFSRLVTLGIGFSLFVYLAVNLAMVTGMAPVVGLPLPFISHGGTSLLTFMIGIGIILCLERQNHTDLPRN